VGVKASPESRHVGSDVVCYTVGALLIWLTWLMVRRPRNMPASLLPDARVVRASFAYPRVRTKWGVVVIGCRQAASFLLHVPSELPYTRVRWLEDANDFED
jgi:hypothetical protein